MKLLLDEMWPAELAVQLRRRGHVVAAVVERPELRGLDDSLIVERACEEERVIFTENVSDFRRITTERIRAGKEHFGLVLATNTRFPRRDPRTLGRVVRALDSLLQEMTDIFALRNSEYWLT